jgi:methyl-accepting chemotaxis protein
MKTLFGKLLISFGVIILLMIVSVLASFYLVYSKSYEEQIIAENSRQALYVARSLQSFINVAYKEVEDLAFNSDVISMNTQRQTPVFVSSVKRNDYFELLYAQGMDGMQTGRSSGNLGNRKERWWFVKMEKLKKPFVSESYYSVGTNMPCASVFYPIMDEQQMIGIMAGDIKLSALHDLVVETADTGSYSFILDSKGVVVAHPDKTYQEELYNYVKLTKTVTLKDAAGKPMQNAQGNLTEEQSFSISEAYKAAIADMMRGNTNSAKFNDGGKTVYLSYRPVVMEGSSDPWYVLSVRDGDIAMRSRNAVITAILASSAIIIVIALFIVFFIARTITHPLKTVVNTLYNMEKGDMTVRANLKREDEFGLLSKALDSLSARLQSIFEHLQNHSGTLASSAEELSFVGRQIANAAEASVSAGSTVASASEQAVTSINSIASNAEKTSVNANEVANSAEQMSMNMNTIASAIEEMSASISEISNNASEVGKVAGEATVKSNNATEVMSKLGTAAKGIGQVTDVIKRIADKTNLLALNATIEAASAGPAGKGFAVVAGEIKELANQSALSADDIARRIESIQVSTNEAVKVIDDVSDIITKINHSVESISLHVGEQTKASNEIANNVAQANAGAKRVASSIAEVAKNSHNIAHNANEAAKGAGNISQSVNSIAQDAKNSAQGAKQTNENADELAIIANDLKDVLNQFKV